VRRRFLFALEITVFAALILITRCANYRDVFANGQIYFVDDDCYARMTRARICFEHPGTIVRHHDFENFPAGTSPHTTAPFDYLIVGLAALFAPFTSNALDLAGAIISPLLAVGLGIFLCWWTRRIGMRFRLALLALYAISPILAHGTALGRPDHQSLLIALVGVALCADWILLEGRAEFTRQESARCWNIVSGASWALAIWVSLYEPLILLAISTAACLAESLRRKGTETGQRSRGKWFTFLAIIVLATLLERRMPMLFGHQWLNSFSRWSGTIGELTRVPLASAVWFQWCGWLVLLAPILLWRRRLNAAVPWFIIALLLSTFVLTMAQARWGYFFALIFALAAPEILSAIGRPTMAYVLFGIALFPVARAWDNSISEATTVARAERGVEQMELRALASQVDGVLLAPWWFSPGLSYWSRQPAISGSSHESLTGIMDSASFYGATETETAAEICRRHQVRWVVSYDSDRVTENTARLLGHAIAPEALCYVLDRHPSGAPAFLRLVRQTARFKLYQVEGL
jgi:hypothetical protein